MATAYDDTDTDELLQKTGCGDESARQQLLVRHRARLRRMVAVRIDRRVASRIDPSDVVQEALAEADGRLDDYLRRRPMAFYPWLRQIAWERLIRLHRHHVQAQCRTVDAEQALAEPVLPDASALALADCLAASATSPSNRFVREELHRKVRLALDELNPRDREILVLRYLEQMTNSEIAEILGISEGAVKLRHLRALERLRPHLDDPHTEEHER